MAQKMVDGRLVDLTPEDEAQRQIDAAAAQQVAQAEATRLADLAAARALVVQTAQTAVGVRYDALSNIQVRALVAILFWKEGALDSAGIVRSLNLWVRQQ